MQPEHKKILAIAGIVTAVGILALFFLLRPESDTALTTADSVTTTSDPQQGTALGGASNNEVDDASASTTVGETSSSNSQVGPRGATESFEVIAGPVKLTAGQTLKNKKISNPNGNCLEISAQNGAEIVIEDSIIGPCADSGVYANNSSNVRISHTAFKDIATKSSADKGGDKAAVHFAGATKNIIFSNSTIDDIRDNFSGSALGEHRTFFMNSGNDRDKLPTDNILVENNVANNAGRNFVQIVGYEGPNIRIVGNRISNELGNTSMEDFVNLYATNGTKESPVMIQGNYIRGGGPSRHGTGIILGDGAQLGANYQSAIGNVLVNSGQVGIGIFGGVGHTIEGNKIYSDRHEWTNVGLYAYDYITDDALPCANATIKDNQVNWIKADGSRPQVYAPGTCGTINGLDTNEYGADIDASIWDQ